MDSPVLDSQKTNSLVNIDKFIFILSAPRSGSTLLRVLLNRIPEIVSPPETYFLEFYRNNKNYDPSRAEDRKILADYWVNFRNHLNVRNLYDRKAFNALVVDEARSWADIFSILVQLYARDARKKMTENSIICEKTPLHIEFQKELLEIFPKAHIVYLIRDPRDVVASLKTCPWSTSNVKLNANYWCKTTNLIQDRENSILIKYEDLVETPEVQFGRISQLLQIDIDDKLFQDQAPNEDKESLDPKNLDSYKPIDTSFKDRWKTKLSEPDHELEVIENLCFKEMKKFNYVPTTQPNYKFQKLLQLHKWTDRQYGRIYRRII